MGWSYNRLWKLLIDRGLTREQLRVAIGASSSTMSKMSQGENIAMDVLNRICNHLNCSLEDIVEHLPDQGN